MKELPTLTLHAESLFSKWGFCDGDMIGDWLDEVDDSGRDIRRHLGIDYHRVLRYLVRTYLLPLIPGDFTLCDISTAHNPIRVNTWRGEEWDDYADDAPAEVADTCATIPGSVVAEILERERRGELE